MKRKLEKIRKKIEKNIRRIDQWKDDNDIKSPRLIKALDSLDQLVLNIKEQEGEL